MAQYAADEDFLSLYIRACGTSEIPAVWNEWSAISLIAACLNDRVWYAKHADSRLYANLYITLVGDSGSGKDFAIERAAKCVDTTAVYKFHGKLSGAGLADVLGCQQARDASSMDRPTIWLTLPELSNSIGGGTMADDFIKRITALYSGNNSGYREVTRGLLQEGRELDYGAPLINCLFGSAQRWLIQCVSPEAIESGAFGRILTVPGRYVGPRITDPKVPTGYKDMMAELERRVTILTTLEGPFHLTPQAAAVRDRWYQTRPDVSDARIRPSWRRADDNILKVAMAFMASNNTAYTNGADPMAITVSAWNRAKRYVAAAHAAMPDLLKWAGRVKSRSNMGDIEDILVAGKRMTHSALLKKAAHRGIDAKEIKAHVTTLCDAGVLIIERTRTGGKLYNWLGA